MGYEAILWRLTKREATYLQITYFRGRRKRGKEKEAESTCLDQELTYMKMDHICTNREPVLINVQTILTTIDQNSRLATLECIKYQPQIYEQEFSSLQLPVGWTSVCVGFIAQSPYIAITFRFNLFYCRVCSWMCSGVAQLIN